MPPRESQRIRLPRREIQELGGCLSKLPPLDLVELLAVLDGATGKAPSLSTDERDDCAVLSVAGETLLATTDFGPLVGDDLHTAGRIAALNAISDIYACGGAPQAALAMMMLDRRSPLEYAEAILVGLAETCANESAQLIGGHTLRGHDTLVGLTVIGRPMAERLLRKQGAQPGDALLLSKPLGVGIAVRAYRLGLIEGEQYAEATRLMCTSNGPAARAAVEVAVHAATDVTGFGLLGHLCELLGDRLGARLELDSVPVLPFIAGLDCRSFCGEFTDGILDFARSRRRLRGFEDPRRAAALVDPQTNGGLLVAACKQDVPKLTAGGFQQIGEVTEGEMIDGT